MASRTRAEAACGDAASFGASAAPSLNAVIASLGDAALSLDAALLLLEFEAASTRTGAGVGAGAGAGSCVAACGAAAAPATGAGCGASAGDAAVVDDGGADLAALRCPVGTRIAHQTSATSTSTMAPISAARGGSATPRDAELAGGVVVRRRPGGGASRADEAA